MWLLPALLVAVSVCSAFSAAVEQIALTYGARDTEMVVTFAANTLDASAEVLYGHDPQKLTRSASASGSQYTLGNYTSPMLFKATLTGLEPGNGIYFYSAGSQALGYTEPKSFRSHPGVGVEDVTFEVFGDLGQTENSETTLDELMKFQKAVRGKSGGIISMGDLSYANGDQPQWDTFGNFISTASSGVPLMTTLGNHEWFDGDGDDTENHKLTAYLSRYPNPPVNHKRELYYSFDAGLAHFVMVAGYCQRMKSVLTQPCLAEGSPEMEWLTKDLASVDRSKTPWVIAVFHQPYVNSNFKHSMKTEGAPMKKAVEDVLNKYQVDLVFSGHVHSYERSKQVYDYKLTPGAPYYITIGDGGNAEGLAEQWIEPQPEWSAYRQASYGFGELRVVNSTAMEWRWHQNQDLLPVIADSYTFTKGAQGQKSLRGSVSAAEDKQPSTTGRPVFADSERGRRAAAFNAAQLKRYAEEQAQAH